MENSLSKKNWCLFLLLFMCTLIFALPGFAQERQIRGQLKSTEDSEPIPGIVVKIKGKETVASTDINGEFSIPAQVGDVLEFSGVGFQAKEVTVAESEIINVDLATENESLNEVVVVGYGTQQKKLNTGATIQISGEEVQRQSTTNVLQGLQGQTPGVQIASTSGQPGEGLKVNIRGAGTIGNANPLYVVDGVLTGDINYLNPADIQSIDVLKDAASAAIYGSQAANGVVLITTKQGKRGQPFQLTLDSYIGVQNILKNNRVDILDAQQYAMIMNEAARNSGVPANTPRVTDQQLSRYANTDWFDEILVKDALTQNYSLGAQGATEGSLFSTGFAYTSQEGVVGGKSISNYERYNFRINTEHSFYKDIIKIGQHLTFAYIQNNGISVGNQYNNGLRNAFQVSPFVPMYDSLGRFWDNSNTSWNTGETNPYAVMALNNQNRRNNQRVLGDVYIGIEPIKNLRFRTSLGIDYNARESRAFFPIYKLSANSQSLNTRVQQSIGKGRTLIWDNVLSYKFNVTADHQFEALLGSSAYTTTGSSVWGENTNLIIEDLDYAFLNNASNRNAATLFVNGAPDSTLTRMSYFGRLSYNFKEKILFNATLRADGSSKFAEGNRWGYFPSVSAGYVISNESFIKNQINWLNYFKIRGSWGQVGNQSIAPFQYLTPINFTTSRYTFGPTEGTVTPGAFPSRLGNPALRWETSEQLDFGFDATVLNGMFTLNFDWYDKATKDWLIAAPIVGTAGADAPFINGGSVNNRGVELGLVYKNNIGDFSYNVGINGAYNKNTVGSIPTRDGIIHGNAGELFDNASEFYRAQNGYPIGYFWGLKTNGIFQNGEEVKAHNVGGKLIQPNAVAGDFRYVDLNNDGIISDLDRTMLGKPNPDFTFGFSIGADFKGFDFSVLASGVQGNEIVQSYRNLSNRFGNYTTRILGRWNGEGTSNTIPRVTENNNNFIQFSDYYVRKGDYLRINNITLGYDLGKLVKKNFLKQARIYVAALNAFTFTKYDGMDPEIGYGTQSFASGIDIGYYPRATTYMVGTNFRF